jgi:polysaccharide export outer membrane protein
MFKRFSFPSRHLAAAVLGALCIVGLPSRAAAQAANYVLGPQDILSITVWDQPDMTGKYTVEGDGTFAFPMVGRIKAGGLKVRDVETAIKKRLADGYIKNPQLSVGVEQYRSQRIFIVGEVRSPGAFPLTGDMTLIEALAHAGSLTGDASQEAVIVRAPAPPRADSPAAAAPAPSEQSDGDETAEVLHIDLKKLAAGVLSQNVRLRDGDTIFVARVENIFVLGQVKSPGPHPVQKDTTVLQAISLAGGTTERGSTGRIRLIRTVNGKQVELKAKLGDIVQPGDTIVVLDRIL